MSLKDFMIALAISLGCFPIVLSIILFASGYIEVNTGWGAHDKEQEQAEEVPAYSAAEETLAERHSKAFKALEKEREELATKEKVLEEEEERLNTTRQELDQKTQDLDKTKKQLEELVDKSATLEDRKVKQLSDTYGAMRPEEAAPILSTLTDALIVRILDKISDERKRAKLLAALGNISKERAGVISKLMSELTARKKPKGKAT